MSRLILICCVVALLVGRVNGTQLGAEVHGIVTDDTGGPAVGASVTLTDSRKQTQSTTTDAKGAYAFHNVVPGSYELVVVLFGFAPVNRTLYLEAGSLASVNSTMRVALDQRVEVVSSLEEFRRVTGLSPVGLTLGPDQLGVLPDDPELMLQILREISATTGRADEVTVYVDGQPVTSRLPPKNAIQSIRISTNSFASEFAEPSAGLVEIVTKPAAQNFRGESQVTFNDSALNAPNAFENPKRPRRTQGYTGYLGGPIVPGRWSFLGYGGRWTRDERLIVSTTVVDPAQLALTPFVQSVETPARIDSYSLRTDVTATPRHLVSVEFARTTEAHRNIGLESGLDLPERGITRDTEDDIGRLAVVSMFGQRVSSELRVQVRRRLFREAALTDAPAVLVLDSFNAGGNQAALGQDRTTREGLITGIVSRNGEKHTVRGGVQVSTLRLDERRRTNHGGTFIFGALVDRTGNILATPIQRYQRTLQHVPGYGPSSFSIGSGEPTIDFHDWQVSWFGQDDIRLSPDVTLSLGVRHDMQKQAQQWWLDVAPRAGIAWTPNGSRNHTLRAALGVFYSRIPPEITLDPLRYDQVGFVEFVVDQPAFFPAIPATLDAKVALQTVRLKGEVEAPRTIATTTSYEWQATKNLTASIDYTHRRGDRVLRSRNLNTPDPLTGVRPYLDRGPVLQFESTGISSSDRLRASLRRVFTRVSMFATYVLGWSQSDTDGPYTVPADSRTLLGEYGRAGDDERHRLVVGSVITLPREWSVSGLLTVGSGRPFNITSGFDNDGDLLFLDRPVAASPNTTGVISTPFGDFDLHRDPGEPMIARNTGQGPRQMVLNLGLAKTFRLDSQAAGRGSGPFVIFSISAENILNRVNFADFNDVVTSPQFGVANRALNPRRIDLAARVGF